MRFLRCLGGIGPAQTVTLSILLPKSSKVSQTRPSHYGNWRLEHSRPQSTYQAPH